ncbi:MAG TPA: hypothetical protein VJY41_15020 [Prolixibacteraceae bacterium]|nr:hypothetical protein [Prolixibacteraceae bacterium]
MDKNLPSSAASTLHTIKRCFSVKTKPPSSSLKNKFYFSLFPVLILLLLSNIGFAQSTNEAEWNGQGYSLKKIVSNNSIPSGVNFSYTIIFSAPAGASNITIVDDVPQVLGNISVPIPSPVNGVTPSVQINGNTVTYALNGLPAGVASSGSFTIVTSFPAGVTCPGTGARNRAGIYIGDKLYHTPFVSTSATAEDPWKISKSIISGVVSNPMGGGCQYLMNEGETVRYSLHVSKKSPFWGNTNGQLNASGAVVSDVLPAGAQLVSSSPNAGTVVQNGNTIEWTIGSLLATTAYTNYTCNIDVYYPAGTFPIGTIINNQANLNAVICGQSVTHQSNETCIKVDEITPNANATFYKQISLTNRVPGCQGYYDIVICNNGNVPFSSYNITDAIPQGITVSSVNVYNADATTTFSLTANNGSNVLSSSISGFYNSGNLSYVVNNLNLTMTNQHPVGKCIFLRVYFSIDNNVTTGQQITNCAVFNGQQNNLTLSDACVTFVAEEGQPRPCLNKDICNVQSDYEPGDTLRFRLRVQNIGSATLSGANVQDVLHSNFSYIGNESYYQATTYNVTCATNGQIPANTTAWQGVSPSHSGSTLNWNLPDIASDCQLFYVGFCSYYGTWGLPYYFIEFDVVVQDYAMPGVTPNKFEISGGNLPQTNASNTVYALVVASLGQQINKQVSADNGANYSTSATVAPGSNARYRLSYTNTSNIPLSNIEMVDLLPYNDNTNDWLILNRSVARASQFGVGYTGNHATSLVPSGSTPTATVDFSAGNNLCLPNYGVNVPGCNAASWNSSPDKNVRINYGLFNLAPAQALNEDFDISVASTIGDNLSSCNDFAAHASANFLLNGSPQSVTLTPIAAPPVCIISDKDLVGDGDCCKNTILKTIQAPELGECCVQLASECDVDSFRVDISNGTFFASSWNCGTMPTGYVGQSSYTFNVAQCAVNMKSCITADSTGVVSANYTIYYSNGEVCEKFIDMDCKAPEPTCCDNTKFELIPGAECCVNLLTRCEVKSVEVIVQNGTIGSANWNCGTLPTNAIGQSSYTFDANNCAVDMQLCFDANQTGVVFATVNIVYANGETCTKELKVDCKVEEKCCENTKLELISDNECCVNLVTKCEVKSVEVKVENGTIGSASWNCGTLPANAIGQSSYTFDANNCVPDMKMCFDATQSGAVTATFNIVFANGEKCTKKITLKCQAEESSSCCPTLDFKMKPSWPLKDTYVGYFSITNPDPNSPICSVKINPVPNGTFSTGNLWIDGNLSGQSWTSSNIPASGSLSPTASNTIDFVLKAKGYKGTIEVCVIKCDGTVCCFEVNWNKKPIIDVVVGVADLSISQKLIAVSVSPYITSASNEKVKYVSFGYLNEDEANDKSKLFAASVSGGACGDAEIYTGEVSMGSHNAFFELACPYTPTKGADLPQFNLVFAGKMPKVACALFNQEGDVIYSGSINVASPDTTTTSVLTTEFGAGNMNELLKLYPNPNTGEFTVSYTVSSPGSVIFQVVNNVGQVLKTEEFYVDKPGLHEHTMNVPNISMGLNHVILKTAQGTKSKVFIRK